jgi:hypothetical protein
LSVCLGNTFQDLGMTVLSAETVACIVSFVSDIVVWVTLSKFHKELKVRKHGWGYSWSILIDVHEIGSILKAMGLLKLGRSGISLVHDTLGYTSHGSDIHTK